MNTLEWNDENLELYQRHILLHDIGIEGQERLFDTKVLVIGVGAIGSNALYHLASAGIGTIGILGDAVLGLSDICSQILYTKKDVGKSKLTLTKARIKAINPHAKVRLHNTLLEFHALVSIFKDYDLVLDCTDNFAPKCLINAVCIEANTPLIFGGIVDLSIQALSIKPKISACYSCVFGASKDFLESYKRAKNITDSTNCKDLRESQMQESCQTSQSSPTCAKSAIIGSVAGILGSIQATEAIKIISRINTPLYGNLLTLHTREMRFVSESVERNKHCPICADKA